MKILTLDNETYKLEKIPEFVDDKMRFAVLDNSDPANPDYFYIPLIFLESFNSPAAVLQIGKYKISMPLDWKKVIGEAEQGVLHVMPITSLNDRGYTEVKWYFPKIKSGQLLAVPLADGKNPPCAYFVKDISRQCELLDYGQCF